MQRRVVIIGAGPGGLASAMLLAKSGVKVTVLERLSRVGGRTATFGGGGYTFDLGPTFFLYPRVLEELYNAVGRDLWSEVPMVKLDPQYRLVFGEGGELITSSDADTMAAAIDELSPGDGPGFHRFMADNRDKLERFRPALEQAWDGWSALFSKTFADVLPVLNPHRSLQGEMARYFRDRRVQLAFTFQAKYLGMSPFRCPSVFSIISHLEYEHGVYHPLGGVGAISENMAEVARDLGVEIRLSEPVEELIYEGKRVVGARTAHGEYLADAVVVNGDFARAMQRLVPDERRPTWNDKKIERANFSCSTFMMYLGVEGTFPELEHHNIFVPEGYEEHLKDIESRHVLSEDPSFYVQVASKTDGSLAPRGHSTLYVLVPVTHATENVDWRVERERYRALVLRQLEKVGIRDVERRIRYEHIITPADWDSSYEIHKGATFNLGHDLTQMLHLRPHNRFDDVPGMYIVGGGTHPGSGLPVIYESARISSRLLLQDLKMGEAFPEVGETPVVERRVTQVA